jgi:hypothetical protein
MSRWLLVLMVFVSVLANALLSQAVPTALLEAYGNDRVRTARMLGRLSSCGALLDVLLTPQLGRLSDTIGRRPLLLIAPCMALTLRAAAACRPGIANLMALRVLGTTLTSTYLVCLRASLADAHRFEGTGKLTGPNPDPSPDPNPNPNPNPDPNPNPEPDPNPNPDPDPDSNPNPNPNPDPDSNPNPNPNPSPSPSPNPP